MEGTRRGWSLLVSAALLGCPSPSAAQPEFLIPILDGLQGQTTVFYVLLAVMCTVATFLTVVGVWSVIRLCRRTIQAKSEGRASRAPSVTASPSAKTKSRKISVAKKVEKPKKLEEEADMAAQSNTLKKKKKETAPAASPLDPKKKKKEKEKGPAPVAEVDMAGQSSTMRSTRSKSVGGNNAAGVKRPRSMSAGGRATGVVGATRRILNPLRLDDFEVIQVIGQGGSGDVLLVTPKKSQAKDTEIYALKSLDKAKAFKEDQVQHVKDEKAVMASLEPNPFLVTLFHSFQDKKKLYLILEYVNGGELFTHLARAKRFSVKRTRLYVAELVLAFEHLHKSGIMYRDLKPENILLDSDGHIKLADFGMVKVSKDNSKLREMKTHTFCGTPVYFSPEVISDGDAYGKGYGVSCDWWTVGILTFEMLTGSVPWKHANLNVLFDMILNDPVTWPREIPLDDDVKGFVEALLAKSVPDRLGCGPDGVEGVKNHPFFAKLDWGKVLSKRYVPEYVPEVSSARDTSQVSSQFSRMSADQLLEGSMADKDQRRLSTYTMYTMFSNFTMKAPLDSVDPNAGGASAVTDEDRMVRASTTVLQRANYKAKAKH